MASHIGGTTVFVHASIQKCIININTTVQNQSWLQLTVLGASVLGLCYVPPPEPPFYSLKSIESEKVQCCGERRKSVSTIEDANARLGGSVWAISQGAGLPETHIHIPRGSFTKC